MPNAVITGGTSGIGLATAELLAGRGYRVVVTGSTDTSVAAIAPNLPEGVVAVRADSRSLPDTDRLVDEVRTRFGQVDLLFLNAGVFRAAPLDAVDERSYDELFDINTKGQFFTLQKMEPLLAEGASVVITVGIAATRGIPGASVAAGSRGALLTMVPSLAVELAPRRIRVNAVSPGAVDTPLLRRSGVSEEDISRIKRHQADHVPLGRLGRMTEIAETVAFLASDGAAYVTGQEIVVGGGADLTLF
ncbi:SDR family oxidoreductase [Lentzea albida]|uniref:NAD(P)-dependent dehydrogenase, short-chain alcohol dehydrogenase family n=1 Tax=Lentzea albida TaxID=65499 RepID=A0A1H9GV15_9PSEU|nr:SDR family oxidoreductase [Lentzea albida]SEQ53848.1 NAD(P)-dependent dehydrogenase, short-chain alcohol dehydrogenase family [Lentzea albida]